MLTAEGSRHGKKLMGIIEPCLSSVPSGLVFPAVYHGKRADSKLMLLIVHTTRDFCVDTRFEVTTKTCAELAAEGRARSVKKVGFKEGLRNQLRIRS